MNAKEDNIVKIAKALSDKTRIKILKEISATGRMCGGEVEKIACLSQPTVSHHLKILTDAGLVYSEKSGRHMLFSVNEKVIEDFGIDILKSIKSG